jgi:integrase
MARPSRVGVRGLYRSADGRYEIDVVWRDKRTHERKRYRERLPVGAKAAAAKRRAHDINNAILEGTFDPHREAPATLGPAFDRWLAHCATHGIKTVRDRETHGKALRGFLGEHKALASLAPFDVERFKASMRASGRSPATVNRHVSTLKTFAVWAAREGLMERSTAATLRDLKSLREPEGRVRYLSPEEEALVSVKLKGWLRPVALACKFTGARLGEITSLRWRDVDRSAEVVRFTRTKTDRTREVAIVPALADVLDTLHVGGPDAFVFPMPRRAIDEATRKRSEEQRRRDIASKAWAAFAKAHGLTDLRAHDLRHHAATMIRRAGGGLDTVAKVLGHSSIQTSARYAHVEVEDTRAFLVAASAAQSSPGELTGHRDSRGIPRLVPDAPKSAPPRVAEKRR